MKKVITFVKSNRAPHVDMSESTYRNAQDETFYEGTYKAIERGFIRIDGRCYPAYAVIFKWYNGDNPVSFIRTIILGNLVIGFSASSNYFWLGPIWAGECEVKYLS